MTIYDIAFAAIRALNQLEIPYLVVGGIATMYHGFARTTDDVDFVVTLQSQGRLAEVAALMGPAFQLDPQATFEVYSSKTYRTIHVKDSIFRIDFFFASTDPFDLQQMDRRQLVKLFDHNVFLSTPEDIIVTKVRWQRKKDLVDASYIIGVQGDALDWPYIEKWCDAHGTRQVLEDLRREIPPI